jgi:phage FluMu protein Com
MKVQFTCEHCGKVLAADDQHAGKQGKCPQCAGVFTIPTAPAGEETNAEADQVDQGTVESGPKACPSCGAAADAEAVICVSCGYNFKTGKQLSTVIEEAPPEEEEEEDHPEEE